MAAGEMTEAEFTAFLADCLRVILKSLASSAVLFLWIGVISGKSSMPHDRLAFPPLYFRTHMCSPRNYFSIARKIPREILRRIERKPHSTCRALPNLALGILATHVGLDPARADRVDRHRAP